VVTVGPKLSLYHLGLNVLVINYGNCPTAYKIIITIKLRVKNYDTKLQSVTSPK